MASATVNKSARISIAVRLRSNRLWIAPRETFLRDELLPADPSKSICAPSMPNQLIPFPFFCRGAAAQIANLVAHQYIDALIFGFSLLQFSLIARTNIYFYAARRSYRRTCKANDRLFNQAIRRWIRRSPHPFDDRPTYRACPKRECIYWPIDDFCLTTGE